MKPLYSFYLTTAVITLLSISCRTIKPSLPTLPASTLDSTPPPLSNINVPVTVNLKETFDEVNRALPRALGSGGWQDEGCNIKYIWDFNRDDLQIGLAGNTIKLSTIGRYSVRGCWRGCVVIFGHCVCEPVWVCAGCGYDLGAASATDFSQLFPSNMAYVDENGKRVTDKKILNEISKRKINWADSLKAFLASGDAIDSTSNQSFNADNIKQLRATAEDARRIEIGVTSTVSINPNWQLTSVTQPSLNPIDRCRITFLSFDVTDKIVGGVLPHAQAACGRIDARVAQENLKSRVEPYWQQLFNTIPVSNVGFIQINPTKARLSSLNGTGDELKFSVGLTFSPVFSLVRPPDVTPTPLPDAESNTPGSGFNVYVQSLLNYDSLSRMLNNEVKKIGKISFGGKKWIQFKDVKIFGLGNEKLLVKAKFIGKAGLYYKGWLYLQGTPQYNSVSKTLSFSNLQYSLETKNILLRLANFIAEPVVTSKLKEKAKWQMESKLRSVQQSITNALNRKLSDQAALTGSCDNVDINGILPLKSNLIVRINAEGAIQLNINP